VTTLGELIAATEKRFRAARLHYGHGTEGPRDEAAFLVLRSLRLPFETPLEKTIAQKAVKQLEPLVRRRIEKREPAAYLLKEAWLDGMRFYVDERVIIPRSHIAFLLKKLPAPKRVLDLCTGSGCLAALAARAFPEAEVVGADISPEALAVARKNVGRRVRLVRSDLFDALQGERFDLILTNPPYVDAPAMRALPREYRHEPRLALAAGSDGLIVVERILREAKAHLAPRGLLLCEVGDSRRALERRHPRLPFAWPHAAVFQLRREKMG
jgi:ribosomal protein L3 glutamine methyltransferase